MSKELIARLVRLAEEEKFTNLRILEKVDHIAEHLAINHREIITVPAGVFQFESQDPDYHEVPQQGTEALVRSQRPSLPDPRLVRRIIKNRQIRARYFNSRLFADPAWDMLLDLTAACADYTRVSVTSLCVAAGVPATTALRWIGLMEKSNFGVYPLRIRELTLGSESA